MIDVDEITSWLSGLALPMKFKFVPGPEFPEYGVNNRRGMVTEVPGGAGLLDEGATEETQYLIMLGSGKEERRQLVAVIRVIDDALNAICTEDIWGTRIEFVERLGSWTSDFDAPERVTYAANYTVREGR